MTLKKPVRFVSKMTVLIFWLSASCVINKDHLYRNRISAIEKATRDQLDRHFVSICVNVGKDDPLSGPELKREAGYFVLTADQLYLLLFKDKYTEENYRNFLFATLVKGKCLYLTEEELLPLTEHLLPKADADKSLKESPKKLIRRYAHEGFLPTLTLPGHRLDSIGKCVVHNLINNGYVIYIEDETGYLTAHKAN